MGGGGGVRGGQGGEGWESVRALLLLTRWGRGGGRGGVSLGGTVAEVSNEGITGSSSLHCIAATAADCLFLLTRWTSKDP